MDELTLTTSIVTGVDGFRRLAGEWDALVDHAARRTYFLRWHWNWLWWTNFAPAAARLHVICCRDRGGVLCGLAPLYLNARPVLSVLPLQELQFLGTGIGLRINEYMDVLARPGHEAAVCRAIGASLAACREWDRLRLYGVPREGSVSSGLVGTLDLASRSVACDRAPYVDTSLGWEAYKSTLGKSMRRNVEYYPRRLFQQRACTFARADGNGDVDEAMDDLIRLHQARWQAVGQPGSFSNEAVVAFLRAAAQEAARTGSLRLWRLQVDGVAQAALIGFVEGGTVHYFQTGFNPAMPKADLGTVVLALSIKDCCEDPAIDVFDFMGGVGYKSMWARDERVMLSHEAWRSNVRTLADGAWTSARNGAARLYRAARGRAK